MDNFLDIIALLDLYLNFAKCERNNYIIFLFISCHVLQS